MTIPPPPDRDGAYDRSGAALGRDLVIFGGQRWPESSRGELLRDAFLWSAPVD
ncbi:hypothetical protein [Candidatus Blastococcus massiliensis]|uniref:hypothetical protein n=1 Tax=Candidatus Blastococcus massiliensis TaxID=1470358 RepID=UPI0004B27DDE|nr:hypothetical protein [Candidatus Blastococcus massiliensis]